LRAQRVEQTGGRDTRRGKPRGAIEEAAPIDAAVHVGVEEAEDLRMKVVRRQAWFPRVAGGVGHRSGMVHESGGLGALDPTPPGRRRTSGSPRDGRPPGSRELMAPAPLA